MAAGLDADADAAAAAFAAFARFEGRPSFPSSESEDAGETTFCLRFGAIATNLQIKKRAGVINKDRPVNPLGPRLARLENRWRENYAILFKQLRNLDSRWRSEAAHRFLFVRCSLRANSVTSHWATLLFVWPLFFFVSARCNE